VRLRELPAVFVGPTLAVPAGSLKAKAVVILDPTGTPVGAGAGSPLPELFRRAAAAGAHAVLVLPRPGYAVAVPSPGRAAELASGSGLPIAAWLSEPAARGLLATLVGAGLEAMQRLEWRTAVLPFAVGTIEADVGSEVQRQEHHNLVAIVPGRMAREETEAVAVVANLPGSDTTGGAGQPPDRRAQAVAAAELLAVATAFQALSAPPRRAVVLALADPGVDGLEGARRVLADKEWGGRRLVAAVVLAGGLLAGPTEDVSFVGARASPLAAVAARAASSQRRRVVDDPSPGLLGRSPAWAFIQAGVPAALLAPGLAPRGAVHPAMQGPVDDARLAFRLVLELAEGPRPPRVDPARVVAVLQTPAPGPAVVAAPPPRPPGRPALAPAPSPAEAPAAGETAPAAGGAEPETATTATPSATAPRAEPAEPAETTAPTLAPSPTPPQRRTVRRTAARLTGPGVVPAPAAGRG
jgi:hypothetical protein